MTTPPATDARTIWDVMRDTAQILEATLAADRDATGERVADQYRRLRAELGHEDPAADPSWQQLVTQLPETVDAPDAWPRLIAAMSARAVSDPQDDVA
jgi:hypothetical protein